MLLGLLAVAVPVIIHLFNRKSDHTTDWGAMQFLADSMATRTRRIQLEDALLMATRCLIFGMIALALARPFAPPGSKIPYIIVLPAILIGIGLFAVAGAVWQNKKHRAWLLFASVLILALTAVATLYESYLNLRRLGGGEQDIALIIDSSTSMTAQVKGDPQNNFQRAVDEARDIVLKSGNDSAFTIISGGPSPVVHNTTPISDRTQLSEILDSLTPSDGQMRGYEAVQTATKSLATGKHDAKRLIVLTDAQNIGWQIDNTPGWDSIATGLAEPPQKPQLILRQLPMPSPFRNLAVTGINLSRDVIGIDREVEIEVTLKNTGTEAVTPKSVQLRIGGKTLKNASLGQFQPGMEDTLTFKHRFKSPGAKIITATARLDDDLDQDNSASHVLAVIDRLNVMIIDGNPAPRFFDRASAFIELALAPGLLARQNYLIEPTTVPAPQILNIQSFDAYQAVILADVPRLPAATARELSDYVSRGGGLLIAPGQLADPEFYNDWDASPARLENLILTDPQSQSPRPDLQSFNHEALRKVADPETSDLNTLRLDAYWQLAPTNTAAALDNNAPFIAIKNFGSGKVIMTACSLDTRSGNLATRESFLPLVHELVYDIANPSRLQLNLPPSPGLTLPIDPSRTTPEEQILASYPVTDPRGQLREANLTSTPAGTVANITGPTIAGLYEIEIPETDREQFANTLTRANTIPFTVTRPAAESQLTQLSRSDLASLSNHIEVLRPESTKEVHTILAGRSYGQELWKYLALGVLILLVLEIALSRWIATNRKTGHQDKIDFDLSLPKRTRS